MQGLCVPGVGQSLVRPIHTGHRVNVAINVTNTFVEMYAMYLPRTYSYYISITGRHYFVNKMKYCIKVVNIA